MRKVGCEVKTRAVRCVPYHRFQDDKPARDEASQWLWDCPHCVQSISTATPLRSTPYEEICVSTSQAVHLTGCRLGWSLLRVEMGKLCSNVWNKSKTKSRAKYSTDSWSHKKTCAGQESFHSNLGGKEHMPYKSLCVWGPLPVRNVNLPCPTMLDNYNNVSGR